MKDLTYRLNHWRQHTIFRAAFILVLLTLLPIICIIAVAEGQGGQDYPLDQVIEVSADYFSQTGVAKSLGLRRDVDTNYEAICSRDQVQANNCPQQYGSTISDIRWSRVMMAALIGAGLATAGVAIQGTFRNPLADPSLIGVSGGAAIGATLAIWQDFDAQAFLEFLPRLSALDIDFRQIDSKQFAQALAAFVIGLVTTGFVYRVSRFRGRTDITALLLIGLAINTIAAAFVGMVISIVGREKVGDINAWTFGGVSTVDWQDVYVIAPFILITVTILPLWARQLNLMALGEADARYLGVNTERLRIIMMSLAALMVGVAVAFAGIIAFVGLLVPQVIRMVLGPNHYILLPTSALGGAIFLILADLFARTVDDLSEIPLGSVTTLIGGPFFLLLIFLYLYRGSR
jgi:iron complex transport system permease protein